MSWLRKVLFYCFAILFLVFCPMLILYSLGYFYKAGSDAGIVKTGLVYAASVPPGADVYLGRRRFREASPALIRDLLPGRYELSLYLEGYRSWTRSIPVEAGKATAMDRILLLPASLPREVLFPEKLQNLVPVPETPFVLLIEEPSPAGLHVFDSESKKIWPLAGKELAGESKVSEIYLRPESRYGLFEVFENGETRYFWSDLRRREDPPVEFFQPDTAPADRVYWNAHSPDYLFLLHGRTVDRFELREKQLTAEFLKNLRGFGMNHKNIYAMLPDETIARISPDGEIQEYLLRDRELFRQLFEPGAFYQIRVLGKNVLVFLDENGRLVTNRLPYVLAQEGIRGISFHNPSKKAVVWTQDEIGIIDFSQPEEEKVLFEKGPRIVWVFRTGRDIDQAFWVYEDSHILFRDASSLYLLELKNFGKPHVEHLFDVKAGSSAAYSENTGKVYYLDRETAVLTETEILPKKKMLFLPYPEIEEEKKESGIQEA